MGGGELKVGRTAGTKPQSTPAETKPPKKRKRAGRDNYKLASKPTVAVHRTRRHALLAETLGTASTQPTTPTVEQNKPDPEEVHGYHPGRFAFVLGTETLLHVPFRGRRFSTNEGSDPALLQNLILGVRRVFENNAFLELGFRGGIGKAFRDRYTGQELISWRDTMSVTAGGFLLVGGPISPSLKLFGALGIDWYTDINTKNDDVLNSNLITSMPVSLTLGLRKRIAPATDFQLAVSYSPQMGCSGYLASGFFWVCHDYTKIYSDQAFSISIGVIRGFQPDPKPHSDNETRRPRTFPAEPVYIEDDSIVLSQQIKFILNKDRVDTSDRNTVILLNRVADIINGKGYIVNIEGHADQRGFAGEDPDAARTRNQVLSDRRAHNIMAYLIRKGVKPRQLSAKGFGITLPLASCSEENHDPRDQQCAQNRRVEFKIVGQIKG